MGRWTDAGAVQDTESRGSLQRAANEYRERIYSEVNWLSRRVGSRNDPRLKANMDYGFLSLTQTLPPEPTEDTDPEEWWHAWEKNGESFGRLLGDVNDLADGIAAPPRVCPIKRGYRLHQ